MHVPTHFTKKKLAAFFFQSPDEQTRWKSDQIHHTITIFVADKSKKNISCRQL